MWPPNRIEMLKPNKNGMNYDFDIARKLAGLNFSEWIIFQLQLIRILTRICSADDILALQQFCCSKHK